MKKLMLIGLVALSCNKVSQPEVKKTYHTPSLEKHMIVDRDSVLIDGKGDTIASLSIVNASHVIVKNLVVEDTISIGIKIYSLNSGKVEDVLLEGVKSVGHKYVGLDVYSDASSSMNNITIKNSSFSENGYSGVTVSAEWPSITIQGVKILNVKAFNNKGILGQLPHTGHGIVVSGTIGAIIDSCEAWNNGYMYGTGNIGIWTYDSRGTVIKNSSSYKNKSSTGIDGGGFDADGGASDVIIENCLSYDNDGAGYLLYEYGSPNPTKNIIFRNNISMNDGRKGRNYSCFSLGGNKGTKVENILLENNKALPLSFKPAVTYFNKEVLIDLKFQGNNF